MFTFQHQLLFPFAYNYVWFQQQKFKKIPQIMGFQLSAESTGRYLTCISRDLTCSTFQPPLGTTANRRSHFNLNWLRRDLAVHAIRPAQMMDFACKIGGGERKLIPLILKRLLVPYSSHCDTHAVILPSQHEGCPPHSGNFPRGRCPPAPRGPART